MPVVCTVREGCMSAVLSGEIDHHHAKEIMAELDRRIDESLPRKLILDCAKLTFMDSSGIAVVLRAWRRMGELGGSVQVTGLPPQPQKVLQAAGIQKLIRFV